jgi:hypothetical protein
LQAGKWGELEELSDNWEENLDRITGATIRNYWGPPGVKMVLSIHSSYYRTNNFDIFRVRNWRT